MLDSITESTVKQYEGCLRKWLSFADHENIDAFNPQNIDVIKFLTNRFNEGENTELLIQPGQPSL